MSLSPYLGQFKFVSETLWEFYFGSEKKVNIFVVCFCIEWLEPNVGFAFATLGHNRACWQDA